MPKFAPSSRCSPMTGALVAAAIILMTAVSSTSGYYNRTLFKSIVYNDTTNDDAIHLNAQQLLARSGYNYEEYYSIADDGYITQLIRIVSPAVERRNLKRPPVLLYHGANIDNSAYLSASSIQHHPERFPRDPASDGPITSSNRSLAMTLANNGFDVWLVGQRGSNRDNQAHLGAGADLERARELGPSFRPTARMLAYSRTKQYWLYGLDDIIRHDIKRQIDLVRRVTNSSELHLFAYSLSTPTTMAFLASHPEYASSVRTYVQMAPAIAADHFTFIDRIYFEKLCPRLPTRGIGFTPTFWIKPAVRRLIVRLSKSKDLTYSLIYNFLNSLFGPSQKYQTNLERNVLARIFQEVSFKSIQHYCQNSLNKRLTRFNYGREANLRRYGQPEPPSYNVSSLQVQNWVVISGSTDGLADATTISRLVESTSTRLPAVQVIAPGFNHLDLVAAVEVDRYVNLPLVEILNRNSQ